MMMEEPSSGFTLSTRDEEQLNNLNLPQQPSWKLSLNFYKYQGYWYYPYFVKAIILFQKHFKPQPNRDILLATPPKSGTTWLKALAFAIQTRTKYINGSSDSPLLSKLPHDIVPCIEISCGMFGQNRDPENPLLHTHVAFASLPESILDSRCKIIYLCRNPKDVLVSDYVFSSKFDGGEILPFEEVYEKFCNGVSSYGPFWDHVLGYWKASLEFPERVLFLKYEDLKNNAGFYVKKMADFMDCGFSEDEDKEGIVEKIVQLCSFENLSNLDVNKSTQRKSGHVENEAYFRKGKVGDWKNYLTPQMAERIDQITNQTYSGCGLYI